MNGTVESDVGRVGSMLAQCHGLRRSEAETGCISTTARERQEAHKDLAMRADVLFETGALKCRRPDRRRWWTCSERQAEARGGGDVRAERARV